MRFWPFGQRDDSHDEDFDAAEWEANRALRDAKQLRDRADDVTGRLQETWRRNHFAEAVKRALRGETT